MKNPIKQATKLFEKLESQFRGDSDSHYMFWDELCRLIEDKLVDIEIKGNFENEQQELARDEETE